MVSQFEPVGTSIAAILFLASLAPCYADPAPVIHYAPIENLEYAMSQSNGLGRNASAHRAADRGVKLRIYLDGTPLAEREPAKVFNDLAETGPTRRHSRTAQPGALASLWRRSEGR